MLKIIFKQKYLNFNLDCLDIKIFNFGFKFYSAYEYYYPFRFIYKNLNYYFNNSVCDFNRRNNVDSLRKIRENLIINYLNWNFHILFRDYFYSDNFFYLKIRIRKITIIKFKKFKEFEKLVNFLIKINGIETLVLNCCVLDKKSKEKLKLIPFVSYLFILYWELDENLSFIHEIKYFNHFYFKC